MSRWVLVLLAACTGCWREVRPAQPIGGAAPRQVALELPALAQPLGPSWWAPGETLAAEGLPAMVLGVGGTFGFVTGRFGRLEAFTLADGATVWSSDEAQQPLLALPATGDQPARLVAAQRLGQQNGFRAVVFDARTGRRLLRSAFAVLTLEKSELHRARLEGNALVVDWESRWDVFVGGAPLPSEVLEHAGHRDHGPAWVDLVTGRTHVERLEHPREDPPPALPETVSRSGSTRGRRESGAVARRRARGGGDPRG